MPIYEYACSACGVKFDVMRPMKDSDRSIECVKCHSIHTHRIQSACFSQSQGRISSTASSGCGGCSGGSCSTCGQ